MKKILLASPELEYTGAVQSFRRMCKVLKENGYDVQAVSYKNGPFMQEMEKIQIDVKILDIKNISDLELKKFLEEFDLIIANTIEMYRIADIGQELCPTIWYIREADNLPEFFEKDIKRREAFERAKNIYVVSEYARDFIVNNFNENVRVLHNCVEDESSLYHFVGKKKESEKTKFLALGTIEERKGYDIYIDAYLSMNEKLKTKCEVHYAGRLLDWAKWFYEPLMIKTKNEDGVIYHGTVNEREKLMQLMYECDCVVVPSRDESCSLVVLEAAMMGKPIIVTENIGAKYLITPECGWIVKTGDKEALKTVFEDIVNNPTQLKNMGIVSRRRYEETSTYRIYSQNLLNAVEDNLLYHYKGNGKTKVQQYLQIECEPKLYSFDVFDTLITRTVAIPTGIFTIMQNELCSNQQYQNIPDFIRTSFCLLRIEAEKRARRDCGGNKCEDITLDEIYKKIEENGITKNEAELIKQLEVETEKRNIIPINANIDKLKKLIAEGKEVILVSDMYLPSNIIRELLLPFGECFQNIPIYVSCEYKKCKHTGNLFRIIRRDKEIAFHEWNHYGDNPVNDVKSALKLGIHGNHLRYPSLYDYEKKLNNSVEGYAQLVLGTARNIRINTTQTIKESVGSCIAGVILYPYVSWVLENAQNQGIEKLYFVARDGYVLKQIADIIINQKKLPIRTEYLYGSRKAWRMCALTTEMNHFSIRELIDLSNYNFITTVDLLAQTLQVETESIYQNSSTAEKLKGNKLRYYELYQIIEELEDSIKFSDLLESKFYAQREKCLGYLKQTIDFSERMAFVELSGSGYTQHCLQILLDKIHPDTVVNSFYYVCKEKKNYIYCNNYRFLQKNIKNSYVVELFARSLENQTIGYEERDGKYYPIFDGNDKELLEEYHYEEYISGVMLFSENFTKVLEKNPYINRSMGYLMSCAEQIFTGNYQEILDFIADMPFDNTGYRKGTYLFAPKLTEEELRNIYFLHSEKDVNRYYEGNEFSLAKKRLTPQQWDKIRNYEKNRRKLSGQIVRGVLLLREHGWKYSTQYIWGKMHINH